MNESEKQKRADARKKRKRRQMFIGRMIIVILLFIILGLCAFLGKDMLEKKKLREQPGAGSDPVLKVRVRQIPQAQRVQPRQKHRHRKKKTISCPRQS